MKNQMTISDDRLFAHIGRLTMRIILLEEQLALLQQQIAQAQLNGQQEPESPAKVVKKEKA